ncbi:MAG: DUF3995 domain-containing protein [Thermoanaerobaculia bacterium]
MPIPLIVSLLAAVLGFLSALHVYWAFGGRGVSVNAIPHVDGRPVFSPSRASTLLVAGCLAVAALVALLQGAIVTLPVPPALPRGAAFAIGAIFFLRAIGEFRLVGFFKRVRGTPFATWDSWLYSPLCLLIGTGFLAIARG